MRTYGRITNPDGTKRWVVVETDADGSDDLVWIVTLCQNLLLNLGESPFYANNGIPAKPSVVQQVMPDFYVWRIQALFAQRFASLIVSKQDGLDPVYNINVVTNRGERITQSIPQ